MLIKEASRGSSREMEKLSGVSDLLSEETKSNSVLSLSKDNRHLPEIENYAFGCTVMKIQDWKVSQQRFKF